LGRTGLRAPVVFPAYPWRQGHQDRLRPAARLQAEQRATVIEQVELDVTPAAIQLELPFPIAEGLLVAGFHDREVGRQETISRSAEEVERTFEAELVQVIEENAADTAGFATMLQIEVIVAPLLVAIVERVAERHAQVPRLPVPVEHVLVHGIEGCEVETAAEPPGRSCTVIAGLEEPEIRMRRRNMRVPRVQHQRYPERLEAVAGKLRSRAGGAFRKRVAKHVREPDAGLLEDSTVLEHAARPTAACFALPAVRRKRFPAVDILERVNDTRLEALQVIPDS